MRPPSVESLKTHLNEPHVSGDEYAHRRIKALGRALAPRKAVYLDVRFWIGLREAARGNATDAWGALLQELRGRVRAGAVYCPVSDGTFLEIFKQGDADSRAQTASLVDELSLGVCIIGEDLRVGTEIAHLVHTGLRSGPAATRQLALFSH